MDFTAILTMSLVVFGLVGFYAIGMMLNKRTPLPEGYDSPSLKCASCTSTSCSFSKSNSVEDIKKEIKESLKLNNSGEGVINE